MPFFILQGGAMERARLVFSRETMFRGKAQSLWNQRKEQLLWFVEHMVQLHSSRGNATANADALKGEAAYGIGNKSSGGINLSGDVKRLCQQGRLKEALGILDIMSQRGIRADTSAYASLLQECFNKRALQEGKRVHGHMTDTGFKLDIFLRTKLVIMYAACGNLVEGRRVLDEMPKRNVASCTAMIAAYARHGYDEEALALFYQMQQTCIQPNEFTFASVLPACANLADLEQGKEIHEDIVRNGFQSDVFVERALVDMYCKCGSAEDANQVFVKMAEPDVVSWNAMISGYAQNENVDKALKLFQKMPERDAVSWNSMITGYVQNGHVDDALKYFQKMPERDVVSWNSMISGYAQTGHVDKAQRLFQKMPEHAVISWNSLITGYAQNGRVGEALNLFQKMPERNAVSWNAMIAGYAQNGHFKDALELFPQMQLTGAEPNSVTFASVLSACANLAALELGKVVHEEIIRAGFWSNVFVANALVDMYAKCGSIEDAGKVFDKMPVRNVVSWTAMILGNAMHGCGKEALLLFEQMQRAAMKPDHVTFVGALSACCHAGLVDDGLRYFESMSRDYHLAPATEHCCCIVDLLGRAGRLDEAQDFINKMPIKADATAWGSLLGACRVHNNIKLGELVAERLFELDPENAAHYVLLSNIYAAAGRWDDVEKVRKLMKDRRIKKIPGCSWIEVSNKVYSFITGDKSHPQTQKIYEKLEELSGQMKESGYIPNKNFVLHDVEEEQKEHILCHHSEKLAIAFGLINMSPGTSIRIVKNLRICGDCHSAIKFISKIVAREIVVRDANRFHHFKDGWCSCGEYW